VEIEIVAAGGGVASARPWFGRQRVPAYEIDGAECRGWWMSTHQRDQHFQRFFCVMAGVVLAREFQNGDARRIRGQDVSGRRRTNSRFIGFLLRGISAKCMMPWCGLRLA